MRRATMAISVVTLLLAASVAPAGEFDRPSFAPRSEFQVRLGGFFPSGDSDFWDENEDVFTLDSSDFDDFALGFTYVHSVSNQVEIGLNLDIYDHTERSEYRDYTDSFDNSIRHDTELATAPMTVDVRFVPGGRYRIRPNGRFVPKPVFYFGAGGGMNVWEYEEFGDFIAFAPDGTPDGIFRAHFDDDGVAFEIHALAGVEMPLSRTAQLVLETRYSISDDKLGQDFSDLDARKIDLGGSSFFGGFSFRF